MSSRATRVWLKLGTLLNSAWFALQRVLPFNFVRVSPGSRWRGPEVNILLLTDDFPPEVNAPPGINVQALRAASAEAISEPLWRYDRNFLCAATLLTLKELARK
jgi:hypothetical protein